MLFRLSWYSKCCALLTQRVHFDSREPNRNCCNENLIQNTLRTIHIKATVVVLFYTWLLLLILPPPPPTQQSQHIRQDFVKLAITYWSLLHSIHQLAD